MIKKLNLIYKQTDFTACISIKTFVNLRNSSRNIQLIPRGKPLNVTNLKFKSANLEQTETVVMNIVYKRYTK